MMGSGLSETIDRLAGRAASAVVARSRASAQSLNAVLLRRLAATPGHPDSLIADPVFEAARTWQTGSRSFGDLAGNLLHPDLVAALDAAASERMPRDRQPFAHQLEAWQAARDGHSFLVTSGTGSGKTECFMVPMLDGLLRDRAKGRLAGVRAIVIYPLNALIESQRARLAAWTERLQDRITFAMYNGMTPETPRQIRRQPAAAELGDRRSIRTSPPAILVTNVTMLEYLLLRAQDRDILERSQGLLRWVILDEAHSYVGAQAAEMALLLRRVRSAFGVGPDAVQLIATSATISEGSNTREKLQEFVAKLAGHDADRARVIEGRETRLELPPASDDRPLDPTELAGRGPLELWEHLASHPRLQRLKRELEHQSIDLTNVSARLFDASGEQQRSEAQTVLDAAALAQNAEGARLLPWRAHVFQRALGGVWACIDPSCPHRDPELVQADAEWGFGAVHLRQRDKCHCGAPAFEMVVCNECGTGHLRAGRLVGASARLVCLPAGEIDEFAVDAEPDPEVAGAAARDRVLLRPATGSHQDRFVQLGNGLIFDNAPPEGVRWTTLALIEDETMRNCCGGASQARLQPLRYGPAFFLGNELPVLLEALAPPLGQPGLPMGGRRALSFSDSRQGTARLAAKLQQDAERTLTRAFLYHAVQEGRGPDANERAKLEKKLALYRTDPDEWADDIQRIEDQLAGGAKPVAWSDLVDRLAQHAELRDFAREVWRERSRGGRAMAEDPQKLATVFLYRELFRRPKVQNNPETLGLLRLAFPRLEERARSVVPTVLKEAGVSAEGWIGLALAAIDFGFRDNLAVDISPEWMVRWVTPRGGWLQAMCPPNLAPQDRPEHSRPWPGPKPHLGNPSRLHRLVYALVQGDWENPVDQDRAGELLTALWNLITGTVARDIGRGAWRLDFRHAAVARLEQGWLCPVTRRAFGYSPAGRTPYDPVRQLLPVAFPLLPLANAGGLAPDQRLTIRNWCGSAPQLAELRGQGLWTNLHDRIAEYAPFLRAQEHSAQIDRPVLEIYEQGFREGRINILNCTTTMEMGVDIPHVSLVVNANVPPSVSNYRQRVGRAGRRGEPFAFAFTFCRDLPWDEVAFAEPPHYLTAPIPAPAVRLDSSGLVTRHVHAAVLGAFLRSQPDGFNIRTSAGAFFGAIESIEEPVTADAPVEAFITWLRGERADGALREHVQALIRDTVLAGRTAEYLCAETAQAIETLLGHWRAEHGELLARASAAGEAEVKVALLNRARRMRGDFLLGELARRGFTPAYGFPVDVVTFDHLSGHDRDRDDSSDIVAYGERRGGASRTLDVAIREYAPGAEVVVDGLVHLSEGVLPAWGAQADASGLEDLQVFWECDACRAFGLTRLRPDNCPACDTPSPRWNRTLRPAGFLGRRAPHTGYENLGHVPYQMPQVGARTPWRALVDPAMGRLRADPVGQVVTLSSGIEGCGYALCLLCGRAEPEVDETPGITAPLPDAMRRHAPLANGQSVKLVRGYCPGGLSEPQRIQRNVRFAHEAQTDVFELQLPSNSSPTAGLAVAAAIREALAERLGTEVRELGVAVAPSVGPAGEPRVSIFLHDRTSGGAGFVTRLGEPDWFSACLEQAQQRLECPQNCINGCSACVLRPDLSFAEARLDRPGGLALVVAVRSRLHLPDALRVFGGETRALGQSLRDWLDEQRRAGTLRSVSLFLHGRPGDWDLATWPLSHVFARLREAGTSTRLVIDSAVISDTSLDMGLKLDLHRLATHAALAHTTGLPMAGMAPVLAIIEQAGRSIAIATPSKDEAVPGPNYGLGGTATLVLGRAPASPQMEEFDSERLVTLSAGNARLIRLKDRLDGPVTKFGRAFWGAVTSESPLLLAAIKTHGVSSVEYIDRYLITPLNLRLLFEVLSALPGRENARVDITTARSEKPERPGWAMFHPFAEDGLRRQVAQALFTKASFEMLPKASVAHARSLTLTLGDGRRVAMLLDQGLGAWRTATPTRHDFRASPAEQARALRTSTFSIRAEPSGDLPMILED